MFKQKAAVKQNKQYHLTAPVGGLDAASPIMGMPENRCVVLDNFFPEPRGMTLRDGFLDHVTGFASPVKTLHVYSAPTGGESLWATTDNGIFDATTAGAVGSTVMALTEGKTVSTSIATGAGNYLLLVNGVETLKQYDGSSWTSTATFGATATSVYDFIALYRQRIFLVKKNSLEVEYLSANAVSGTATNYPMGAIFPKGGYIIAIGSWTIDSGLGPEDKLAIVTSKGEVAVFNGDDPATWAKQGVYYVGLPIGNKCLFKYGGDLLILTETGLVPLSEAVQSTSIDRRSTVSQNIRKLLNDAANSFKTYSGWQIISDPNKPFLLINVPASPNSFQFVMHSQTQAWATYSGWNALCFERATSELYFGTTNSVCRVTGRNDNGANITGTLLQAYTRLKWMQNKKIELIKPYVSNTNGFIYTIGIGYDLKDPKETTSFQSGAAYGAAIWGTSLFGEAVWTGITGIAQDWQTVPDEYTLWKAMYLQVVSKAAEITYYGSDILMLPGQHF